MFKSSRLALWVLGAVLCTAVAYADDAKPAPQPAHPAAPKTCMHDTGTRIKLAPDECSASAGRSYTKEDVDRTGKTSAGGALRLMDPSITIH
jgi:hypothetical protein